MHGLADVLAQRVKLEEAENLARRMIAERQHILGKERGDTWEGVHALAKILARKGEEGEALGCFERACVGMEKCVGRNILIPWSFERTLRR
jgi:hypothetical protein